MSNPEQNRPPTNSEAVAKFIAELTALQARLPTQTRPAHPGEIVLAMIFGALIGSVLSSILIVVQ